MNNIHISVISILIASAAMACGSTHHSSENENDPFFVSFLPENTPPIAQRYDCKDGFYIDRSNWTDEELTYIQHGMDAMNLHAEIPGLVHFTSDDKARCKFIKDPNLGPGAITSIGETLAVTTAEEYSDGHADITISVYSNLTELAKNIDDPDKPGLFYESIISHEIFHSLRANHIPSGEKGLMAAVQGGVPTWSDADSELCRNVRVCPSSQR